ncbi:MAG TPA: hypothetical protein VGS41_05465, partial [Chthonomonadales bacterium]|nr:hypothetical protein [Chthonomonadales bacterium]
MQKLAVYLVMLVAAGLASAQTAAARSQPQNASQTTTSAPARPPAQTPGRTQLQSALQTPPHLDQKAIAKQREKAQHEIKPTARVRDECPVRLGGVFLTGFADAGKPDARQIRWITSNTDLIAVPYSATSPGLFTAMMKADPLLTPLLAISPSALHSNPSNRPARRGKARTRAVSNAPGRIDRCRSELKRWISAAGKQLAGAGAFGLLLTTPPSRQLEADAQIVENDPVSSSPTDWLRLIGYNRRCLLVPNAADFDAPVGHPTLPVHSEQPAPDLIGRMWDETYKSVDGAWCPNWTRGYHSSSPL